MASLEHEPTAQSSAFDDLCGTVLEQRYELGRVLKTGGMGAVFEARQLRLDRPVAIKVLRPLFAAEREHTTRFLREAKATSKIRHRNVVEILDYGETAAGMAYSVMEFLVGQDLQQLLNDQPGNRLPWPRTCGLLVQIASGLKAAHGKGVIHRDIKPANCFLADEDGEPVVKLVDFGIAKLEGNDRGHTLTGTAQVLGTPGYIAPELVRTPKPAGPRSDIYSLGVLAYRMLSGRIPFRAKTVFEILRKACFEPIPSLRALVPGLPAEVESLVFEMLDKDPARRPPSMLAVRDRLVALGRQTFGVPSVEVSGANSLRLDIADTGTATELESDDQTTQTPIPSAPGRRDPRPPESPDEMTKVVSRPVEAPRTEPEPNHSWSESVDTARTADEPSSPSVATLDPSPRPPARHRTRLIVGLAGALATGGSLLAWAVLDRSDEALVLAASEPSPTETQLDSPAPLDERTQTEIHEAPAPDDSREPTSIETTAAGLPAVPHTADPTSSAEVEFLPSNAPAEPLTLPSRTQAIQSKGHRRHAKPPPDSTLTKKIERRIRSRCAKIMGTDPVTVKFFVDTSGSVMGLTTSQTTKAGRCAMAQVRGKRFRPRDAATPIKITVERS